MKKYIRRSWVLPVIFVITFIVSWQLLAEINLINKTLFSAPLAILDELVTLHTKEMPTRSLLLTHIGVSLKRSILALMIGSTAGVILGLGMGVSSGLYEFFDPVITVLMPIPGIALAPLFIITMGFGDPTIITVGSIATFFPLVYNTTAGVRSIDTGIVNAARTMGVNRLSIFSKVYLPWAAGHVLTGLKLGLARCWRTVIAVEFIAAANYGLGYLIWDAAEYLRVGVVYGGIFLLIGIYFILEKGFIDILEKNTIEKWGMINK